MVTADAGAQLRLQRRAVQGSRLVHVRLILRLAQGTER